MPEYLAPAVYVEEVDTGSKPIEGVSTSTAGMIGVTERGPVNVPILVTSYAEFQRIFGQTLDARFYGVHRFLPHGVEGFFTNGGKRVYVTRVLNILQATAAERQLVAPDIGVPLQARLITSAAPTTSMVVVDSDPGFLAGNTVQIDDGLSAEFHQLAAPPAAANTVTLRAPLSFDHAAGQAIEHRLIDDATPPGSHSDTLQNAITAGNTTITVTNAAGFAPALNTGNVLRVGILADDEELVVVSSAPVGNLVSLQAPLRWAHPAATQVRRQNVGPILPPARQIAANYNAAPGDAVILANNNGGLTTQDQSVRLAHADPTRVEYRRIGALNQVGLLQPTYADYPVGTRVERMTPGAASGPFDLLTLAHAGDTVVNVSDRTTMNVGDVIQVGLLADRECFEIVGLPATVPAPNPGLVVIRAPLRIDHAAAVGVVSQQAPPTAPTRETAVALSAPVDSQSLALTRDAFALNDFLRITTPSGDGPYYHLVSVASAAMVPQAITLVNPLDQPHAAGVAVAGRTPMITVRALDAGGWGNRLRVAMEAQEPPRYTPVLTTTVRQVLPGNRLRLDSAAGVEIGTELLVTDGTNTTTPLKVLSVDRQNDFLISLEATTPLPGAVAVGNPVRSREYRFVVELLRQSDPSNPARDAMAIDREVFTNLSLDSRHSRYFQTVLGCTWNMASSGTTEDDEVPPLQRSLRRWDRRSEGDSSYVRVRDLSATPGVRPGPVATYDPVPGGDPRLVLLPLGGGNDQLGGVGDPTYVGVDHVVPEQRTGLFTLRNIEEISIVAAPGRTGQPLQTALINHCELMRYRFAVLDGQPPPSDSLPDIQRQRQQFDTKYAALYHPWLLVPDPYAPNPASPPEYPIPPSGHMVGIYARTDIERGVHKAPANEVVRGVVGLQRLLNKEQHDILNPYPVNINVIRDFRTNNRGIRVYGGRVITSDSDWKYVNVRRLLIFIEASVDRGLQWVVFEPNSEPLWARVRRSISNFLTLVWRNGALEGTKPEEAYFVKCDRTTMTQTDIDQGRLIVLVGVAPVKPAEFVIVRIGLWTAHAED
jgi:phage tail sheath protein FI